MKASLRSEEKAFIKTVWRYYEKSGRHYLPWRTTTNPYKILVSEVMLQQTQVGRVIPKYKEFLKQFPSTQRLAAASLGDVLKVWQGLGYNRRAKFLWLAARAVVEEHAGTWPDTFEGLRALPGVGNYTAGAVMNFAYNIPIQVIETNIRTVYIHHFFPDTEGITDKELLLIIERTIDMTRPREWNWALMDYGSHLKETVGNLNKKSRTYQKQSIFKNSNRYIRGAIVRMLTEGPATAQSIYNELSIVEKERIELMLNSLVQEGLVVQKRRNYSLPK